MVGANKCAGIVAEACALFPGGRPNPDRQKRWKELEALRGSGDDTRMCLKAWKRVFWNIRKIFTT